jgi:hypothetical protein
MRWTKERPTEPGMYWVRARAEKRRPTIVQFFPAVDGVVDDDGASTKYYEHCDFAGPIKPPEDA